MGIPKFFRFISERWPLISQLIDENQIPEFDNLYLDMNSILHACTHSNDDTLTRLTDDQMYSAIFNYIDHLFQIIKPKKTFYMAIDGVAPRAKMNQQRARRFRTAYEAEENLKKAIQNGEVIPKEDPFDSNSITPGTEFMSKLTINLKYFIHKKITEDSNWANIDIVLSGHEVPGEGEHKIMEYIRSVRSQPDYNPNLRHCIYGLDADLIMLSLVTHDPHFALLREEVTFGPSKKSLGDKDLNDQRFFLLHISLLREYLSLEFQDLENQLKFEYNFERVLDDFILIMYVIGNDFLPNLPDLFINKGAFPLLIAVIKQTLLDSDGYINENGKINLRRLNIYFKKLSNFEFENFEKKEVDVEWFNKKLNDVSISGEKKRQQLGKLIILKDQKKLVGFIKPWLMEWASQPIEELLTLENEGKLPTLPLNKEDVENNLDFIKEFALQAGFLIIHSKANDTYEAKIDVDGITPTETEEERDDRISELRKTIKEYQSAELIESEEVLNETKNVYSLKFEDWKENYYKSKLHFSIKDDKEELLKLTTHYVEGLQWVLYYYYRGVPSWNWFYKYHYAPRISDISLGLEYLIDNNIDLTFEKSHPFKPFEQLMAVLPARSRKLMPLVYRPLMTDEKSPIINFYPHEVDIDMNGKTASWEAVVLLDFVDEKKLIDVLKPIEEKLTPDETARNSYGYPIRFIHNPQIDHVYPTSLPGFFPDLEHDKCYEEEFVLPEIENLKIGLIDGAKTGLDLLAGFPTLDSVPFTSELALNDVKVFNFPSRSESMILNVVNVWADLTVAQFAQQFMNKLVYSKWPFLRECRVVRVMDNETKYESYRTETGLKKVVGTEATADDRKQFRSDVSSLRVSYAKQKGVKLGALDTLVYVKPVSGLIRNQKGAYVKTYAKEEEVYPIQLIVKEVINKDERYASRPALPIDQEFPLDSQVVFLGDMAYGSPAKVVGFSDDKRKLNIKIFKIQSTAEPNIGKRRLAIENKEITYYPSFEVSKTLKISPYLLSRITSQFMVKDGKQNVNIGLELKFESKRQKVLGYTKKLANGRFWEFSPLAVNLINKYKTRFPNLFKNLQNVGQNIPDVTEILDKAEIKEIKSWLKEVKSELIPVSLESESFTKFSYQAIEQYMDTYILNQVPTINKDIRGVPRDAILNAGESYQLLSDQRFELGDRVVYVQDFGKVPILSKGTVASILTVGSKTSLGVIFDEPLLSGNNMGGKLNSSRGLVIDSSLVLNLSNKQFVYHSQASKNRKKLTEEEKIAKIRAFEAKRAAQYQKKQSRQQQQLPAPAQQLQPAVSKQPVEPKREEVTAVEPHKHQKGSNELLSLLRKKLDGDKTSGESEDKSAKDDKPQDDERVDPNAIKQIYGRIYSNVMNQGSGVPMPPPQGLPPPGVPIPYGIPGQTPFPPHPGFMPVGNPMPPNFYGQAYTPQAYQLLIPAPPQQQQQHAPQPAAEQDTQDSENGTSEKKTNGRGGHRGGQRGGNRGRTHSRGNRGGPRGGHRGGRSEYPAAATEKQES
ncbi:5'-3' exoribonuclease 1 [Candida viswanathii]|uniref:5'-3' exoribonuclease 1 n=1 Tax=Candida viswanathii TaxID=5486 RepID=A0A367YB15_9ASCO|nr:5'-3' exoribonuclease 1 [Candida viswanathii]